MKKLPFLISIPHGGTQTPDELISSVSITARDLFDDSDSFTQEIYDVPGHVESLLKFNIARAFVDASRSTDMLPPEFTDGLVKSATCYNKPIYKTGKQPDKKMTGLLIQKYYEDYHQKIREALKNPNIELAMDCHSMAEIAPDVAPDSGNERPLINLGDAERKACDTSITILLKQSFIEVFGFDEDEVTINDPFKGGFITRNYGNKPKPWIQIEMNRKLYLSKEFFDYESLKIKESRLNELNEKFKEVLNNFYDKFRTINHSKP